MPSKQTHLADKDPKEIINESAWEEYSRGLRLIWIELARLNTSLYILRRLIDFPEDIIARGRGDFMEHIGSVLYESSLLVLSKLITDRGRDLHTLGQFRNLILKEYLKEDYRRDFQASLRLTSFDKTNATLVARVKNLRNGFVAHLPRSLLDTQSDPLPTITFEELQELAQAVNAQFRVVCFNAEYKLLPLVYLPEVRAANPTMPPPDIEYILDLVMRDSFFVNMPERKPRAWQHRRKAMTPEKLDLLNKYRRRFGLPEV